MDGLSEQWSSSNSDNDQSLEHVGLLEEIPHDSVCEWAAAFRILVRGNLARFFSYRHLALLFPLSLHSERFSL